jgi:hypothetical protein
MYDFFQFVMDFEKRFIGETGDVTFATTNGDAMEIS